MLGVRGLLPLTLAALVANYASAAAPPLNGWFSCSEYTFTEEEPTDAGSGSTDSLDVAQCATFKAPLCYDGVCSNTGNTANTTSVDIFVKRIQAVAQGKPNIFFMQGGPGASSTAMESAMTGVYALLAGNVNVYTMDHRGTGRSTKLDCVAAQAETSGSPGGTSIDSTEVPNCAADLEFKYGSDMSAFSVTSAASDLSLFISSFLPGEQTFVYGVSYGSSLVERLIHLNTTGIAGYVLDGISTTSGSDKKNFEYFSTWDPDFDEVGNYFLSFCEKNQDECGQFFKETSVSAALKTLTANLDSASYKCTSTADEGLGLALGYTPGTYPTSQALRSFMGTLLEDATLRTFIPVLTYRLTRCNDDDVKVIDHFFKRYAAYSSGSTSEDSTYESDLVYKMIVYSEFWEAPTPSTETMLDRFLNTTISSGSYGEVETYCVFSKENSPGCAEFAKLQDYKASPLTYKRDAYWNVAAKPPSNVSVLLMSSKMDPQTPHKYAEFLYAALDTDNKKLLAFEQATHGTLWSTPLSNDDDGSSPICGMMIVASYVAVGGDLTKMDRSCMDKMPAVTFQVPERLVHTWLNASSAVDGKYTGKAVDASSGDDSGDSSSSSSKYKTVFIVFLVLFIVALVAAAVFLVQWRRAKKASASAEVVEVYVDEGTPKA